MFDAFERTQIDTSGASLHFAKKGDGFPLLLLHGYPQTHIMWHKIAPRLADDRHFSRVGYPRLYEHRYQSAQLELWQPGEVEWFVIIRDQPRSRKRSRKGRILIIQPPLFSDGTEG